MSSAVEVEECHDAEAGLTYFSAAGLHVVAVDQPSRSSLKDAFKLILRLREGQPLDVGMLSLGDALRLSANLINRLAAKGVVGSRLHADSAIEQAKAEVARYLALRLQGFDHLTKFAESTRG